MLLSPKELAPYIANFLYDYHLNNWMGVNPEYKPLMAAEPRGLYALIRISVPACGNLRDRLIAEAIRLAGFETISDERGVYLQRDTSPEKLESTEQSSDETLANEPIHKAPLTLCSS